MFYDRAKIAVAAGNGGNGCVSFRREKHVPRGGPDGGDGGAGGCVLVVGDPQLRDLNYFARRIHFKARPGRHGQGARKAGASGENLEIKVPVGTQIWDEELLLADLREPGQGVVVASGGAGGRGNTRFVTSTRQAPKFAELGEGGESRWLTLTLKLMADVGLAGLPNAGKSSLLRRISNAKPKVADYPFTTIEPMLGVVAAPDSDEVITVADVPGLLEGASQGVGLGTEFLAHLERCYLILHVVDITGFSEADPLTNFRVILRELEDYPAGLGTKPQLVALNKADVVDETTAARWAGSLRAEIEDLRRADHPAFSWALDDELPAPEDMVSIISAATGAGVTGLLRRLSSLVRAMRLEQAAAAQPAAVSHAHRDEEGWAGEQVEAPNGYVLYRPTGRDAATFSVRREGDHFVVEGEAVGKLVRRFDLDDTDAARYLADKLDRMGVYAALREQGADSGDEVEIDGFVFEYQ